MGMHAGRGLGELLQDDHGVAADQAAQRGAGRQFLPEQISPHAQGGSCPLHDGAQGRGIRAQRDVDAPHSFIANQPHFQGRAALLRQDQGDIASTREINVIDAVAGLKQALSEGQVDGLETIQQAGPFPVG
ncbi:hypothetical protein D3C86_1073450 [compost metagenome]